MKHVEKELTRNPADFLIYTGDIAANTPPGIIFAAKYFTFERMKHPVYFTIGNHDFTKGKSGDDAYMVNLGPLWYSFDSNGIHFVVAPMIWDGTGQRRDKPVTYKPENFSRWIRKDLELQPAGKPVVFFAHAPIFDNREALAIIQPEKFNIKAFIHGHIHTCAAYMLAGIPHYSASSVKDGMPFAAMGVYEFDEKGNMVRLPALINADFGKAETGCKELEWQHKIAGGICIGVNPAIWQNTVFIGVSDVLNGKYCGISAVDKDNGKQKWFFPTVNSVMGDMAIKDNILYAADSNGIIYALNCADGKLIWKNSIVDNKFTYYQQGVLVYGSKIIAGFWDSLKAFDCATGKLVWQTGGKRGKKVGRGEGSANILAGNIVINGDGGRRSAVNADTGKLIWQGGLYNFATPVYAEGKLYAMDNRDMAEINMKNGKVKRRYPGSVGHWSGRFTPVFHNGILYTGSVLNGVAALDTVSGKIQWRFKPGLSRASRSGHRQTSILGRLILDGGRLIAGGNDGKVYMLNASDGKVLWSFDTGVPVSGITLDNGKLFVITYTGELYKFAFPCRREG